MGIVYRGRDDSLDRDVAIKVMSVGASADAESRARFKREAQAAARLQHPNIVTIYELGEHKGAPFIAMELLEGIDLQHAITAGLRPNPRVTLPIVLQLLAGLQHAHEHGIVHRDIKPSNVFLPRNLPAKIMDFGVARLTGGATTAGTIVGTPNYMSPEQVQGTGIDGRSDLFSAGLILYELVTGERAYSGATVVAVLFKIAHEPPDLSLLPHTPDWEMLGRVVRRALAHDAAERYPDARAMGADLAQALLDLGGTADWASASDRGLMGRHTPKPMRRPTLDTPRPAPRPTLAVPAEPPPPRVPPAESRPRTAEVPAVVAAPAPRAAVWGIVLLGILSLAVLTGGALILLLRPSGRPTQPTAASAPASATSARATTSLPASSIPSAQPRFVSQATAPPTATPGVAGATPRPLPAPQSTPLSIRLGGPPRTVPAAGPPTATPPSQPPQPAPAATPSVATVMAHLDRAEKQLEQRHFQAAIAEARQVLARDPSNEAAQAIVEDATASLNVEKRLKRARDLARRGDRTGALAEVKAGLEIAPNDSRLLGLSKELGG